VGELPLETQIALLRVLQKREMERDGGTRPLFGDIRVLAATNRDLLGRVPCVYCHYQRDLSRRPRFRCCRLSGRDRGVSGKTLGDEAVNQEPCKSPIEMLNLNGEPGKLLVRSAKSWPALPGGCADWWKEHLANRIDGVVL
jgi:hypothetical protein